MKEMTTAEFAKANLSVLGEIVRIRRYTKVVGTYYPGGFEPGEMPAQATLELEGPLLAQATTITDQMARIEDLESEVKRLKKELAARPPVVVDAVAVMTNPRTPSDPLRPRSTSDNPFAGLPKQDREFFERKLGTKKK